MAKVKIIKILEDKNPITNGRWCVIAQTDDGYVVEGFGRTREEAVADAESKAD